MILLPAYPLDVKITQSKISMQTTTQNKHLLNAVYDCHCVTPLSPCRQCISISVSYSVTFHFLQRCMECNAVLTMRFLSVRLSVKRMDCDKTEEKSVRIFIPCKRPLCLLLWEEEWLVRGDPFYLEFWVNRPALERNRRFWTDNRS